MPKPITPIKSIFYFHLSASYRHFLIDAKHFAHPNIMIIAYWFLICVFPLTSENFSWFFFTSPFQMILPRPNGETRNQNRIILFPIIIIGEALKFFPFFDHRLAFRHAIQILRFNRKSDFAKLN